MTRHQQEGCNRSGGIRALCLVLVAGSLVLGLGASAFGDVVWNSGSSSNWATAGSWNPAHVPGAGEAATINYGGTYVDTTPSSFGALFVGGTAGSTGVVTIKSGGHLTCTGWAQVGDHGTGMLQVNPGGSFTDTVGVVGDESTGVGRALVYGTWTNTSDLTVGWLGDGRLWVYEGAVVNGGGFITVAREGASSVGNITVTGTLSTTGQLSVGAYGQGTLLVQNGGDVTSDNGRVGQYGGAVGTATVTGTGSTWTNTTDLYVGGTSVGATCQGTLNVQSGGLVSAGNTLGLWYLDSTHKGTLNITGATVQAGTLQRASGAVFSDNSTSTVRVNALTGAGWNNASFNGTLQLGHSGGTANQTVGTGMTLSSKDLMVGYNANATLTASGGGDLTTTGHAHVGYGTGTTATATVTGSGSTWGVTSHIYVGQDGNGTVNVLNNATATAYELQLGVNPTGRGTVNVVGGGSLTTSNWASIGYFGYGTLNVQAGGTLTNTVGIVGRDTGSTGLATVVGTWTNTSDLTVGWVGQGTLNVQSGGTVNGGGFISMGRSATGVGSVTVDGNLSTTGGLYVGASGHGTLNVQNGGHVVSTLSHVGFSSGAVGTATVTGSGSTWTDNASMYVGGTAAAATCQGTLNVEDGGQVSVADLLKLWFLDSTHKGTVNLSSGKLLAETIDVSAGADFDFTGGELHVETFIGSLLNDGGVLAPGSSPGLTTITGDYTQESGSLQIELGGLLRGTQYDALDVQGLLTLGGTLDVVLYDGFEPVLGDTFDILNWNSLNGTFADVNLPSLSGELTWDQSTLYTDGTLTVVPEPTTLCLLALGGLALIRRRRTA